MLSAAAGSRTRDLRITRSTLYLLSYTLPTELHGQTDLRLEIMKYILNVINILVYINSASNNTSSASVMLVV